LKELVDKKKEEILTSNKKKVTEELKLHMKEERDKLDADEKDRLKMTGSTADHTGCCGHFKFALL